MRHMRSRFGIWRYVAWLFLGLIAVAVMGGAVMLLWNEVAPALFYSARQIDFLHALGLLVLCRILFGGFRGHGRRHGHHGWGKWRDMSPEEREQFRRNGPRGESRSGERE